MLNLLIKYDIFQSNFLTSNIEKFIKLTKTSLLIKNFILSKNQFFRLSYNYDRLVIGSQTYSHLQLNSQIFLITRHSQDWLVNRSSFGFLKEQFKKLIPKLNQVTDLINNRNFRPIIYFSPSLKEQLKYIFGKNKLIYCSDRHKYLKTKTQFLIYQKDHKIKTSHNKKYDKKDLYNAILIPEYGSWIRFIFQKNTKINSYKYPLKNQEDEIMIQLDKINQKPVLFLLKEIGLTDLDIYQNLQYSDFFYFNKTLLVK